jgi:hypothetical protein
MFTTARRKAKRNKRKVERTRSGKEQGVVMKLEKRLEGKEP